MTWAGVEDFPDGGARRLELAGQRPGEAVPARRADPDMADEEPVLVCPWHGWEYDLRSGRCLTAPERTRVRSYPVRVEGGRLEMEEVRVSGASKEAGAPAVRDERIAPS